MWNKLFLLEGCSVLFISMIQTNEGLFYVAHIYIFTSQISLNIWSLGSQVFTWMSNLFILINYRQLIILHFRGIPSTYLRNKISLMLWIKQHITVFTDVKSMIKLKNGQSEKDEYANLRLTGIVCNFRAFLKKLIHFKI